MKKIVILLILKLLLITFSAHANTKYELACPATFNHIEVEILSEVDSANLGLENVNQKLSQIVKINWSVWNVFKFSNRYSDELYVANQRLEKLMMYVENSYRGVLEIREKFLSIEAQINLQTRSFNNSPESNKTTWTIYKNFYEYKLNYYKKMLKNLREVCKSN